jgi:hypothetical protein
MKALVLAAALVASPALAAEADPHAGHDMSAMPGMDHSAHQTPTAAPSSLDVGPADEHGRHGTAGVADMSGMAGMAGMEHSGHAMPYSGVQGFYPFARDASGTSWQPDASTHQGVHGKLGEWTLMGHAMLNFALDRQSGPRGDDKAFLAGMLMGAARRDLDNGDTVNLRAMLSPDPFMGPSGYPLLLASGETADGRTPLIDRQHPHDLFMELSASYSHRLSLKDALFLYVGLPGEPAFGPPAFMHRYAAMDSPEAPISHHWLDSTHITYGVVTGGWVHADWKVEASRFTGREPDQKRYDIETPRLDSTSVRFSWNPTPNWSFQTSWAELISPEALEPNLNEHRLSASAIYTRKVGANGMWSTTLAWGRKERSDRVNSDALVFETSFKPDTVWTVFSRAERLETDELDAHAGHAHGDLETVGKLSFGAVHDWRLAGHTRLGLGGLYTFNFIPKALEHAYGNSPHGAMAFARLVID